MFLPVSSCSCEADTTYAKSAQGGAVELFVLVKELGLILLVPDLPQLDIIELWIGVNVCIGHAYELPPHAHAIRPGDVQRLQDRNESHIVLYG